MSLNGALSLGEHKGYTSRMRVESVYTSSAEDILRCALSVSTQK